MSKIQNDKIRISLGLLLAVVSLNAFAGGYLGISGAKGVPIEWLNGSPFESYLIPGIILFVIVGGSFLFAAVVVLRKYSYGKIISIAASIILFIWLAVEIYIIGYVSWMQPATAVAGLLVLILALFLNEPARKSSSITK